MPCDQLRRLGDEGAVALGSVGLIEGEVDAAVQASLAEVAVGQAMETVVLQQGLEVAEVGAEVGSGNGRILPPGPGGLVEADAGQPCSVSTDFPEGRGLYWIGDHPAIEASAGSDHVFGSRCHLGLVIAAKLHEHPAVATREIGNRASCPGDHVDDPSPESFASDGGEGQQGRDGIGGLGH